MIHYLLLFFSRPASRPVLEDSLFVCGPPPSPRRYSVYKQGIAALGLDNHAYVVANTGWRLGGTAALEPNLVPYYVEPASHWVLWHHPDCTPGDTDLDPVRARQMNVHTQRCCPQHTIPELLDMPCDHASQHCAALKAGALGLGVGYVCQVFARSC